MKQSNLKQAIDILCLCHILFRIELCHSSIIRSIAITLFQVSTHLCCPRYKSFLLVHVLKVRNKSSILASVATKWAVFCYRHLGKLCQSIFKIVDFTSLSLACFVSVYTYCTIMPSGKKIKIADNTNFTDKIHHLFAKKCLIQVMCLSSPFLTRA